MVLPLNVMGWETMYNDGLHRNSEFRPTSLNLQLGALLTELSDAGHQTLANRSDLPHKNIKEYLRNVGGYFILGQRIRSIDKEGLGEGGDEPD